MPAPGPVAPVSARRVALVGWYGFGNVGDDLLLRLAHDALGEPLVFSTRAGRVAGIDVHHVAELPVHADELDLVCVGGGGLLNRRFVDTLPLASCGVPYGFLAVGVPRAEWLEGLEHVLVGARFVTLRDHVALAAVRAAFPAVESWWLPDLGFLLARADAPGWTRPKAAMSAPGARPRVLLVPRDIPVAWLRPEEQPNAVDRQVDAFAELIAAHESQYVFEALAFEPRDAHLLARLACPRRVVGVDAALAAVAGSDGVIATRMHAGVIALAAGVPALLVDYQDKMRGLAQLFPELALASFDALDDLTNFLADRVALGRREPSTVAIAYGDLISRALGWMTR